MRLDSQFIRLVLPQATLQGPDYFDGICSVDSRSGGMGDFFVALPGTRVDGHAYVREALQKGAQGCMVMRSRAQMVAEQLHDIQRPVQIIWVDDTYEALGAIARAWRQQFSIPIVGITGSVGKTSTKQMLARMLELSGKKCFMSLGNQNTLIGLALNILRLREEHEVALFEMGISRRGEMALLADLVRPTTALITAIGHSHMEGLGSLNDVAAEKRDIFKYFKEDNIGIINGDQPLLSMISYTHPVVRFGLKMTNQVQARKIHYQGLSIECVVKLYRIKYRLMLPTNHQGRIMQGLAAAAAAYVLNVPAESIVAAFQEPLVVKGRFEIKSVRDVKALLIDDCYNANPESMKAALEAFDRFDAAGGKIAVLGDMLELGVTSPFWHRQLGRLLRKAPSVTRVIFVGEQVKAALKTLPLQVQAEVVPDWQSAVGLVQKTMQQGSAVLVKGSRGMKLDQLVHALCE